MAGTERRHVLRYAARIRIIYVHDGDYLISRTRDLSVDGMFISTSRVLRVGDTTDVSFGIDQDEDITLPARVVWVNSPDRSDDAGMGVRFVDPSPAIQARILAIINRIAVLPADPSNGGS